MQITNESPAWETFVMLTRKYIDAQTMAGAKVQKDKRWKFLKRTFSGKRWEGAAWAF